MNSAIPTPPAERRQAEPPAVYLIKRETVQGTTRFQCYREHPDGSRTTLGHFPTRAKALVTMKLLAGRTGTILQLTGDQ